MKARAATRFPGVARDPGDGSVARVVAGSPSRGAAFTCIPPRGAPSVQAPSRDGPDIGMTTDPAGLSRRGLLAALVPAMLPLAVAPLAGCGFQPLYMPTATGNPGIAQRELATVNVALIPDRPGQLLRQALQQRMASDGGGQKRYDLRVSYWIAGEGVAVLTDNSATRLRLTGYANWVLVAADPSQARLTEGHARAIDAMNVFDQQFFALDMQNDTVQRRIAEQVAEQIATQLSIWFRQRAESRTG